MSLCVSFQTKLSFTHFWNNWKSRYEMRTLMTQQKNSSKMTKNLFLLKPDIQCDHIWRYFVTLAKFPKSWENFWGFYCVFGNIFGKIRPQNSCGGEIFIIVNVQILKNNETIWSHCWHPNDARPHLKHFIAQPDYLCGDFYLPRIGRGSLALIFSAPSYHYNVSNENWSICF